MKLTLVPTLAVQRDLLNLPRGRERFEKYLLEMTGGTEDMVLPIMLFNPMSKPHVAAALDHLVAVGAEDVAAKALAEAQQRLLDVSATLKVGIVLADDAQGGWTNRYTTDSSHRLDLESTLKRNWVVVLLWSSESPSEATIRHQVLATAYRNIYFLRHGRPRTLRAILRQEGLAMAFAGAPGPALAPRELADAEKILNAHMQAADYPTQFTCLYGDEAAESMGYAPLGLAPYAGFAFALADALAKFPTPEKELVR